MVVPSVWSLISRPKAADAPYIVSKNQPPTIAGAEARLADCMFEYGFPALNAWPNVRFSPRFGTWLSGLAVARYRLLKYPKPRRRSL
jgi:hypothetical protein